MVAKMRVEGSVLRFVSLVSAVAVFTALFLAGIFMVAGVLEGFKPDVFLAPLRLSIQILLQLSPAALIVVIISHVLLVILLVRILAVQRLRQSNFWHAIPLSIVLLGLYWMLACRGIVKFIARLGQ